MIEQKVFVGEPNTENTKLLCNWLTARLNNGFTLDPATTSTIAHIEVDGTNFNEDSILAVSALYNWTKTSCEVALASSGAKKQKASREYIWHVFNYVFNYAGKLRLNTFIATDNYKSQTVADMLGLTKLCLVTDLYSEGKDGYFYGITKKEWLAGRWGRIYKQENINTESNKDIPMIQHNNEMRTA